jgi:hypothetical protein
LDVVDPLLDLLDIPEDRFAPRRGFVMLLHAVEEDFKPPVPEFEWELRGDRWGLLPRRRLRRWLGPLGRCWVWTGRWRERQNSVSLHVSREHRADRSLVEGQLDVVVAFSGLVASLPTTVNADIGVGPNATVVGLTPAEVHDVLAGLSCFYLFRVF